jgi:two-component system response regulator DevR
MVVIPGPIRVLLIDDHKMFVEPMARVLASQDDLEVVGCEYTVAAGVAAVEATRPDIAIVDYLLPDGDGVRATVDILTVSPTTQVLMLTGLLDEKLLISAIDAGCSGFLTKDAASTELVGAVRQLAGGEAYVPSHLLRSLLTRLSATDRELGDDLTKREREVLVLIASGMSTAAIAAQLFVSVNTVRNHVQRTLLKLDAHSKLEAVAIAVREGLIAPRDERVPLPQRA